MTVRDNRLDYGSPRLYFKSSHHNMAALKTYDDTRHEECHETIAIKVRRLYHTLDFHMLFCTSRKDKNDATKRRDDLIVRALAGELEASSNR